ncbi:antibiotic biosynthesis monooxygenase [Streptomyces lavendulocolor]|uniref:antibiotic biosynthesis monooxygenase n=1 Tax=Streptomyces lavendulocolor TaxID=67316 RepID=UPI0033D64CCA
MISDVPARPDLCRPGVGLVTVGTWHVGSPRRRRAAVDAVARAWGRRDLPDDAGPLSYSMYAGEDGETLLHYAQWTDEAAHRAFVRANEGGLHAEIDAAVPGIERTAPHSYTRYRSGTLRPDEPRVPGCVVIVDVVFDGPDPDRQRDWVDTVFEALGSDPGLHPGGISGHFHLGLDGTRVLNYAEWESAGAHIEALAGPGDGIGSETPQWRRVRTYPGVVRGGVKRYTPALSLSAGV